MILISAIKSDININDYRSDDRFIHKYRDNHLIKPEASKPLRNSKCCTDAVVERIFHNRYFILTLLKCSNVSGSAFNRHVLML